jgi:hypothetical protein
MVLRQVVTGAALGTQWARQAVRGMPVVVDLSRGTFVDSRFAAAIGGWERELGRGRLTLMLPPDVRLKRLLALGSRTQPRVRALVQTRRNTRRTRG